MNAENMKRMSLSNSVMLYGAQCVEEDIYPCGATTIAPRIENLIWTEINLTVGDTVRVYLATTIFNRVRLQTSKYARTR